MEGQEQPCPYPSPYIFPSSIFKDISNFETPKRSACRTQKSRSPCSQFFTASKQTPRPSSSFRRPRPTPASSSLATRSKVARVLKNYELEQCHSSRKAQIRKEVSLKTLAKSLTVWLNFLFENPRSCGCNGLVSGDGDWAAVPAKEKRHRGPRTVVGVDAAWRSPKRQRESSWGAVGEARNATGFSNSGYTRLQESLKDLCSFDDLAQRMQVYLSLNNCKEVCDMMIQVAKTIDEGRIKMKGHCPIVTDVGLKKKATQVLLCYNPLWLRIGLYIIFGGDSLLSNEDVSPDQEVTFLKMIIEKQIFSHNGLAKSYAYNKRVEGLYRPGYYENLGNVVLKGFLLLVLVLDKAKRQNTLSLKYGIDGVDGGSPLLFNLSSASKSSRQVISEFLSSDVMHGEGNLLAHLAIVGYNVSYQQCPLMEYDFNLSNLFEDLQDGVRLCRAIQLLQQDTSILMKLVVPSDKCKKRLANCGIALQHLKLAGVTLSDQDGIMIVGDDIVNGDKELILSLLWNMFVHLQLPLLMNRTVLVEEVCKIRGMDKCNIANSAPLEVLLDWVQGIGEKYDLKIDGFPSLLDGKAIWCLLDHYIRKEFQCSYYLKDPNETHVEESIVLVTDYQDSAHNIILSQKLILLLGNFPEVLQVSDILEHNGTWNYRSVVILLVFLASELIVKKNVDQLNFHKLLACGCQSPMRIHSYSEKRLLRSVASENQEPDGQSMEDVAGKFKAIQAWWQDMVERNQRSGVKSDKPSCFLSKKVSMDIDKENATKVIQHHYRGLVERCKFIRTVKTVSFLQMFVRAWLGGRKKRAFIELNTTKEYSYETKSKSELFGRYVRFFIDRNHFVNLKTSVLLIQRAAKEWIVRRHQGVNKINHNLLTFGKAKAATVIQRYFRMWLAKSPYICEISQIEKALISQENAARDLHVKAAAEIKFALEDCWISSQHIAATNIQSHYRGWVVRRSLLSQRLAAIIIQKHFCMSKCWEAIRQPKIKMKSAIIIQSFTRGWIARRGACRHRHLIVVIQRTFRSWLIRRDFLFLREAAMKIQSTIRYLICWKTFNSCGHAAIDTQRFVVGQITQTRIQGPSSVIVVNHSGCHSESSIGFDLKIVLPSILKLQTWWKGVLLGRVRMNSVVTIQSHIRGWIARRKAARNRHRIVMIQSHWKGYLARRESEGQLLDLRMRMKQSATNVDDGKHIMSRLVAAVSELANIKSVRSILHTCATLDMATAHSQKCSETLAATGAIETLLKLVWSVTRSVPDQEVLKHALSTLRNLVHYPHLVEAVIDSPGSIETILSVLLRNKEEGYFVASELLKKICLNHKGAEAVRQSTAHTKRLEALVEALMRKTCHEKRTNARVPAGRDNSERRLREAAELLKLITDDKVQPSKYLGMCK